jgi:phage terminase large subunit-like protein
VGSLLSSERSRGVPLKGCESPRVFTPPLRPLTPESSLGFAVIEFAEDVIGIRLHPWQKWLYIHALETLDDGSFRFRTVVVLVARQNGKSTWSQILSLFFMYVLGVRLVLGTAQDLDTAEEVWQGAVDLVTETDEDERPLRPELAEMVADVVRVNGKKALNLKTGERYKVKAANRRAGRGLSGDLILLDELREHQTWDAWGAITKTTMARSNALVTVLSNAGDASSVVLRYLRKMAHAAVGDPDGINRSDDPSALLGDEVELAVDPDDSLGVFEWSAPPGCDIMDPTGWAQANPSLGFGIAERTIRSAAKTDPEWVFRTEVLCQWSDGTLEGPFPPGAWEAGRDPDSGVAPNAPVVLGLDVSWDRSTAHIGLAGRREDGLIHVEHLASRVGTDWVIPWLTSPDRQQRIRDAGVVVQVSGAPVSSLVDALQDAGIRVLEWKGADLGAATGAFYDLVRLGARDEDGNPAGLRHRPQPALDVAAATAMTRPSTDAYVWDRKKSPTDIAPLVAVTGAAWFVMSEEHADYDVLASVW